MNAFPPIEEIVLNMMQQEDEDYRGIQQRIDAVRAAYYAQPVAQQPVDAPIDAEPRADGEAQLVECPVCLNYFSSEFVPFALRACGHSFCYKCLGEIKNVLFYNATFYDCPICNKVSFAYKVNPIVRNEGLREFLVTRKPPRCPECLEILGPQRPGHFFGWLGGKRHACGHSFCEPCCRDLFEKKKMFCRACVIQLPTPKNYKPYKVPPKNYALMDEMERVLGSTFTPEREAQWAENAIYETMWKFDRLLSDMQRVDSILSKSIPLVSTTEKFRDMLEMLDNLRDENILGHKDMTLMINSWTKEPIEFYGACYPLHPLQFAEDVLYRQARCNELLEFKIIEGINGWTELPWMLHWDVPKW